MLTVIPIPVLDSNYVWVIQPSQARQTVCIVDPGDAAPVIDYLTRNCLILTAILITHRHRDHTQGITGLLQHWTVPVYGPKSDAIPEVNHVLCDGDSLELEGFTFQIISVPGHTWEHIAYFISPSTDLSPLLFCGDALFAGGCGKRFDGTAEIMWDSLQKLANLPDATQIYCGHEYTQANLKFAMALEPDNLELSKRFEYVNHLRSQGRITLPSTMLTEKQTNPFLRCHLSGIKAFAENRIGETLANPADVFGAVRLIKDTWLD